MNPPVGTQLAAARAAPAQQRLTPEPSPEVASSPTVRTGSGRFDDAALLAYRRAEAEPAQPPAALTSPPPPPPSSPPQGQLQVSFSDSSVQELGLEDRPAQAPVQAPADDGWAQPSSNPFEESDDSLSPVPAPDRSSGSRRFEATGSLEDSGSDILDLDAPSGSSATRRDPFAEPRSGRQPSLESLDELDLMGDSNVREPAPAARGSQAGSFERDMDLLEDSSASRRGGAFSDEDLGLLDDSAVAPPRRSAPSFEDDLDLLEDSAVAPPRGGSRSGSRSGTGARPDLDEVLSMFGPEDEKPLDDISGLEPQPLDLSPSRSGGGRSRRSGGGRSPAGRADPFDDELSDILEPLNPSEAMEIIKSQRRGRSRTGRTSDADLMALDDEESVDLFAGDQAPQRSSRKRSRGVPISASDEDLDLFEDSRSGRGSRGSGGGGGSPKKTDPFARARRAIEKEERSTSSRKPATRNGRASKASAGRSRSRKKSGRSAGTAPTGEGDHGLVLSRISDPDKKDKAAELIAEIKGCQLESAQRLTDRTIIPVLKGVSREVAEFHLDKFKRYKIAGRVTTRQRS
jgi:hypothetical protein